MTVLKENILHLFFSLFLMACNFLPSRSVFAAQASDFHGGASLPLGKRFVIGPVPDYIHPHISDKGWIVMGFKQEDGADEGLQMADGGVIGPDFILRVTPSGQVFPAKKSDISHLSQGCRVTVGTEGTVSAEEAYGAESCPFLRSKFHNPYYTIHKDKANHCHDDCGGGCCKKTKEYLPERIQLPFSGKSVFFIKDLNQINEVDNSPYVKGVSLDKLSVPVFIHQILGGTCETSAVKNISYNVKSSLLTSHIQRDNIVLSRFNIIPAPNDIKLVSKYLKATSNINCQRANVQYGLTLTILKSFTNVRPPRELAFFYEYINTQEIDACYLRSLEHQIACWCVQASENHMEIPDYINPEKFRLKVARSLLDCCKLWANPNIWSVFERIKHILSHDTLTVSQAGLIVEKAFLSPNTGLPFICNIATHCWKPKTIKHIVKEGDIIFSMLGKAKQSEHCSGLSFLRCKGQNYVRSLAIQAIWETFKNEGTES